MYAIEAYETNFHIQSLQTFLNKHNLRQAYKPSVGPLIIYSWRRSVRWIHNNKFREAAKFLKLLWPVT